MTRMMNEVYEGSKVIPRIVPVCVTSSRGPPRLTGNAQMDRLLGALQLEHRWTCPLADSSFGASSSSSSSSYGSGTDAGAPMSMADADSVFRAAATSMPAAAPVSDDNELDIDC